MGYRVFAKNVNFGPRAGLEGPFDYPSGRVLYYDPHEGRYWDPLTDFYLSHEEADQAQREIIDLLAQ
jgi:hypothetical protein